MNWIFVRAAALMITIAVLATVELTPVASAMCPLCTAGAAIGLSVARYYGVDDIVIGLWLGALAVSTALWINNVVKRWMVKKRKHNIMPFQEALIVTAVIASTIVPFYFAGFFNGMTGMIDTIFGINRLIFGTLLGSIIMFIGSPLSNSIKKRRQVTFPFQTIILTLGLLVLLSVLFWYVTAYYTIT